MNKKDYEKEFNKEYEEFISTCNSGATFDDADFRFKDYLVEHKYRNKNTIWINYNWWKKLKKQAFKKLRVPLLIFENEDVRTVYLQDWTLDLKNEDTVFYEVNNSHDKILKTKNYTDKIVDYRFNNKVFVLEYKDLQIFSFEDFWEIISEGDENSD